MLFLRKVIYQLDHVYNAAKFFMIAVLLLVPGAMVVITTFPFFIQQFKVV